MISFILAVKKPGQNVSVLGQDAEGVETLVSLGFSRMFYIFDVWWIK